METAAKLLAFMIVAIALSSGTANATCFSTAFQLEKGGRAKNVEQILKFGQCVKNEERARVGKWFCFVDQMAGIQENDHKRHPGASNQLPKNSSSRSKR